MNWEAFFIIGAFALVLGGILLVPGIWWARRKARENPDAPAGMKVTPAGFLFASAYGALLLSALSTEYWAGDTAIEEWLKTSIGRMVFLVAVFGAGPLAERLLSKAGIRLIAFRESK